MKTIVDNIETFYGVYVPSGGVPTLQASEVISEGLHRYSIKPIAAFGYRTAVRKDTLRNPVGLSIHFATSERDAWRIFRDKMKVNLQEASLHLGLAEMALEDLDREEARISLKEEASKRC